MVSTKRSVVRNDVLLFHDLVGNMTLRIGLNPSVSNSHATNDVLENGMWLWSVCFHVSSGLRELLSLITIVFYASFCFIGIRA